MRVVQTRRVLLRQSHIVSLQIALLTSAKHAKCYGYCFMLCYSTHVAQCAILIPVKVLLVVWCLLIIIDN